MDFSSDREASSHDVLAHEQMASDVFRGTHLGSLFVRRRGVLVKDVFVTYRDPADNAVPRMWPLTKECEIERVMPATFWVAEDGWNPFVARMLGRSYAKNGVISHSSHSSP